ncbi:hypothetical protein EYW49_20645 [Siculibacillus lacustris]|uniref:DUF7146 domain-containing protein n=1 Tax=Siculibacillus lacustris TaxID=1549641 RepID=A0A4Q9VEX6_9HYPH|nr:hypothetical protein [Siculibacillus lacustris]TBW33371.1 hypothetical protein EYW49_20645 [Siculibacillus lacustris]
MTTRAEWVEDARLADIVEVAGRLGAKLRQAGRELVGPCPLCGGRGDKLQINPAKRIFNCGHDGGAGGDVVALVCHVRDYDPKLGFLAACEWINGTPPPDGEVTETPAARQEREQRAEERRRDAERKAERDDDAVRRFREKERERAYAIWNAGVPLAGSHAAAYLAARGILHQSGLRLRFAASMTYWVWSKAQKCFVSAGDYPVMLAAIVGADGRFLAVHQTFLDPVAPRKALIADPTTGETRDTAGRPLYPPKKVRGPRGTGIIHLTKPPAPIEVTVGEGIETTASVRDSAIDAGRRVDEIAWIVGVSLGNLGGAAAEAVRHPDGLKKPDARGRLRLVRIPGPEPDWTKPGIVLPPSVRRALLLCDGDSDRATVDYATRRAARRWARAGVSTRRAWPTDGLDFNDMRQAEMLARPGDRT